MIINKILIILAVIVILFPFNANSDSDTVTEENNQKVENNTIREPGCEYYEIKGWNGVTRVFATCCEEPFIPGNRTKGKQHQICVTNLLSD